MQTGTPRESVRKQAARRRAVQVEALAVARVEHRDHERAALAGEAHVSDETLVEDGVDEGALAAAPLREPPHAAPFEVGVGHFAHGGLRLHQ